MIIWALFWTQRPGRVDSALPRPKLQRCRCLASWSVIDNSVPQLVQLRNTAGEPPARFAGHHGPHVEPLPGRDSNLSNRRNRDFCKGLKTYQVGLDRGIFDDDCENRMRRALGYWNPCSRNHRCRGRTAYYRATEILEGTIFIYGESAHTDSVLNRFGSFLRALI